MVAWASNPGREALVGTKAGRFDWPQGRPSQAAEEEGNG